MSRGDKRGAAMVAPQPQANGKLHPVTELASQQGVSPAVLAGLCQFKGWAPGKHVTSAEFREGLEAFKTRPMGGRI